ncbi:MAG: ribosome maturation factor RimP [Candidatus Accumulibacter sp.]|jgi:ribosome maturation factor RimP|nr:ribosome maturation factor RimP [Accumulibacter sp.]
MNLNEFLEKTLAGLGYELVDVERSPQGRVLRIFIDKPEKPGGVDIEDCVLVNNQLSRVLVVENVDYERLEISSPGLDRVLRKPSDFRRFSGSEISLRLRLPLNGRRKFTGVLLQHEGDGGKVRLLADTGEIEFDLENIDKARLVPKFAKSGERV